jgi:hypothetical protein
MRPSYDARWGAPLVAIIAFVSGCKEPMSDDPGYKATVLCTQKMKARADSGKGTRNDSKATCIGKVGDGLKANPSADLGALADCILDAPDEKAAQACK